MNSNLPLPKPKPSAGSTETSERAASAGETPERHGELDRILDIPLTIHVELGRKRMKIRELLDLGPGSIIDLDTAAGTPLAIYANHTLVAHGEAVLAGDRYGIRITDVVSTAERVRRLGGKEDA
jgi:flagellar motor switch protein FliN/FliY